MFRFAILFFFLSGFCLIGFAQKKLWEVGGSMGITWFLGEMASGAEIGQAGMKDIQYNLTKPALGMFARCHTRDYLAFRANFIFGQIAGNDFLSKNIPRHNRNLSFKSNIFEFSLLSEILLFKKDVSVLVSPFEGKRNKSNYEGRMGYKLRYLYGYIFAGAGAFYFNPKALYDGKWYELQPLGTEGQGTPENPNKKYSRIQVCFPIGAEINYSLNRRLRIGGEMAWRYTLTDYLDDVSGNYADPKVIEEHYGPIAAKLSSRTNELTDISPDALIYYQDGQPRGDSSDKDSYLFIVISFYYSLNPPMRNRPKYERTR